MPSWNMLKGRRQFNHQINLTCIFYHHMIWFRKGQCLISSYFFLALNVDCNCWAKLPHLNILKSRLLVYFFFSKVTFPFLMFPNINESILCVFLKKYLIIFIIWSNKWNIRYDLTSNVINLEYTWYFHLYEKRCYVRYSRGLFDSLPL